MMTNNYPDNPESVTTRPKDQTHYSEYPENSHLDLDMPAYVLQQVPSSMLYNSYFNETSHYFQSIWA